MYNAMLNFMEGVCVNVPESAAGAGPFAADFRVASPRHGGAWRKSNRARAARRDPQGRLREYPFGRSFWYSMALWPFLSTLSVYLVYIIPWKGALMNFPGVWMSAAKRILCV
jgi:hypothetical protein